MTHRGLGRDKKRVGLIVMRTLNAFENAFDRMAGGYFLVIALGVAAAIVGVVL